jgi:hypothetical protein
MRTKKLPDIDLGIAWSAPWYCSSVAQPAGRKDAAKRELRFVGADRRWW